ncbi:hypothetical protein [Klebsiella aerogenes]|uniref:hypothetical protein n=1 Tax=Klebsiella aerogenes TaxID=548 RepID=UPI002D7EFB15|nr:hypothetical protein [Klebsiella aerogenes]
MNKSTITRERLQEIAEDGFLKHGESKELARMALVALDSEPVKRVNADQMRRVCLEANRHLDKYGAMAKEVNKLLGRIPTQSAPVVPEEMPSNLRGLIEAHTDRLFDDDDAQEIWNACRAAMLQAEPVTTANKLGNSPVIPDGWKLVPVEPNGDMLAAAQDAYGETDGDIASTLRAAIAAAQPAPTIQETDAMAFAFHHALTDGPLGDEDVEDIKAGLRSAFANATANQPTLVLPDDYQNLSELYHALEKRLFKIAQRIKGTSFDKYAHTPSQAIDVLEESLFGEDDITRRATMLAVSPPAPKSTVK